MAEHEHEPIVVVDDQRRDGDGRPAAWIYHVECLACGADLPEVQVEVDERQLVGS